VGWPRLTCRTNRNGVASAQVKAKREDLTRRSSRFGEAYFTFGSDIPVRVTGGHCRVRGCICAVVLRVPGVCRRAAAA
jgi:hypothetical protein